MSWRQFKALVEKFGGWIEGDKAYFPTPYQMELFLKAEREADGR